VLNHGRDAAMITLVDRPPVSRATIQSLRDAFESAPPNVWAVVPEFTGKHGHPYLVGRELIEVFLQAPATATLAKLNTAIRGSFNTLPSSILRDHDINTPEEYADLLARPRNCTVPPSHVIVKSMDTSGAAGLQLTKQQCYRESRSSVPSQLTRTASIRWHAERDPENIVVW